MENNDKRALVYQHIFADGSKYFGNAVDENRAHSFRNNRGGQYLSHLEKYGEPTIQIKRNLTIEDADSLERYLFDKYISNGGIKLQNRPSGRDLYVAINQNKKVNPLNISKSKLGVKQPNVSKALKGKKQPNISKAMKGRKLSIAHKVAVSKAMKGKKLRANRKVVSSLDGRVSSAAGAGILAKKNPAYIGTWSDYIEE